MSESIRLNDNQNAAVRHLDGPLHVLAGPGTGKTQILQARTAWLINEMNIMPQEISVVTFTRKAAGEIRRRIAEKIPPEQAEQIKLSTLHSKALSIITAEKRLAKESVPEVIVEEAFDYLRRAMEETRMDTAFYSPTVVWKQIGDWKTGERAKDTLPAVIQKLADTYTNILEIENKWDMADLIVKAIEALSNSNAIREASQASFLMVDEWQDTSLIEYRFIKSLLNGSDNLMVVGAPAQSIYTWRGANFEELDERFKKDFPGYNSIKLNVSYRSGLPIIQSAASVVPNSPEVWLTPDPGINVGKVVIIDNSNDVLEADRVSDEIRSLHDQYKVKFKNIVVLFRTWIQSSELEKAFVNKSIPYVLFGESAPFYEKREVRQMLAYLRTIQAMADPDGEEVDLDGALDLIINTPPRGIGPASVKTIRGRKAQIGWAEFLAAMVSDNLREQVRSSVKDLFDLLNRLAKKSDVLTPAELIQAVIRESTWDQWLDDELDGRKIMRNLRALANEAHSYDILNDFIKEVETNMRSEINENGVALTTIHAAKGLEWPVVFIIGMNEGIMPHILSLEASDDPQEEANLAHVAFSRAKSLLVASWFKERTKVSNGKVINQKPSRYLGRIPKDVLTDFTPRKLGEGLFEQSPEISFAYEENEDVVSSGFFG